MSVLRFRPICGHCLARSASVAFNDLRLSRRHEELLDAMVKHQSNVTYQISKDLNTAISRYRFYRNKRVEMEELIDLGCSKTIDVSKDREVLVIGDTTEINLSYQYEDILDKERVGVISDNKSPGILAHVHMAIDAQSGEGLGISDLILWSRQFQSESQDGVKDERVSGERESYKWILGMKNCKQRLGESQRLTFIFDREADIFQILQTSEELEVEVLIRSHYNRKVETEQGKMKIEDFLSSLPWVASYELRVSGKKPSRHVRRTPKNLRQARETRLDVRFGKCQVQSTLERSDASASSPKAIPVYVVEAIERADLVPPKERPIHWRLTTTHPIESQEDALRIIQWYKQRWQIEQLFRMMKKKGFRIEETELEYLDSIYKQTILSFFAAFQVIQLVLERDQEEGRKIEALFTQEQIACLRVLNQKYQGNTLKQKNPHPPDRLAWAAWVIARMGGWKGLNSQGKPGPLTFKRGLERLTHFFDAWTLFNSN